MLPGSKPSADVATRRPLSRWALHNAWKLSALTAVVTLLGVLLAVSLSVLLRPTRSYFFPLLSDVDKHQPEGFILRLSLLASSLLFFATTTASVLHCHILLLILNPPVQPHPHASFDLDPFPESAAPTPTARRRSVRLLSTSALLTFLLAMVFLFITLRDPSISHALRSTITSINVPSLLRTIFLNLLLLSAILAMAFLIWYFLKLQNLPDTPSSSATTSTTSTSYRPSPVSTQLPIHDDQSQSPPQQHPNFAHRFRACVAWCILLLRPICLTGQAVCLIKIVGLWLALDTFSISNIRLVKITLLAALAFAQYTAAFFFAFFMTILAVDMRAKAPPADLLLHT